MKNRSRQAPPSPIHFLDFAIRAWREGAFLQVIAHASPVGGMRRPASVKLGPFSAEDFRIPLDAPLTRAAAVGRELARLILPRPVWELLSESMVSVAPDAALGLRLRLCLDEDLIDLPWEYLYTPGQHGTPSLGGFLLTDDRISLVREPSSVASSIVPSDQVRRGLFVGALFDGGADTFGVQAEHASLETALQSHTGLIEMQFCSASDEASVDEALRQGCDFFHYAGHVDLEEGRGRVVQLGDPAVLQSGDLTSSGLEAGEAATWSWSDELGPRLAHRGTRLAVFNACNSGSWQFVRPFVKAGIPAVIGVQGLVSNIAALNFAEKLYQSLAVGLSLDEAMTYARLYVMDPARSYYDCDWGRFMTYMPTDDSVLFPRSDDAEIRAEQVDVRAQRAAAVATAQALAQGLDGAGVSQMLSEIADRSVLILGRFTDRRKRILQVIADELSTRGRVPILFDFDKPSDRDLVESVVRFASVSRYVIADLSDPKSVPAELQAIVPSFPSLPISLIIEEGQQEYALSDNILRRGSVVGKRVVRYRGEDHLRSILQDEVLAPAETLYEELIGG